MSYILDALRKSDKQRQRGTTPTLLLAAQPSTTQRQLSLPAYGLLAVALLGAGMAIGWLRPWEREQAPAPLSATQPLAPAPERPVPADATPSASRPLAPPLAAPSTPDTSGRNMSAQQPTADPSSQPLPPQQMNHATVAGAKPQSRRPAEQETPVKPQRPAFTRSPGTDADDAAPAAPPSLAELPLAVRRDLPPMSIMVHAYSAQPADRLVGINNKLLHEGDEIAPGLRLEEITPDGMVLNYKGQRFHRGVH